MYKYLKTYAVLNYIDALITYLILSNLNDPRIHEYNQLYVYIFPIFGMLFGLFLFKTFGIAIYWFMYYSVVKNIRETTDEKFKELSKKIHITMTRENNTRFLNNSCIFLNIVYVLIVINNLYWLYQNFK